MFGTIVALCASVRATKRYSSTLTPPAHGAAYRRYMYHEFRELRAV